MEDCELFSTLTDNDINPLVDFDQETQAAILAGDLPYIESHDNIPLIFQTWATLRLQQEKW